MKRGFFASSQSTRTSAVHEPSTPSKTPASISRIPQTDTGIEQFDDNEPLIKPKHDHTVIEDGLPLILLADYRIDDAPYFGYFPPNKAIPEMVIIDQELKTIENAALWEVWKGVQSGYKADFNPSFVIKAVESKGMAMVAARDIKMGELICKERCVSSCSLIIYG